MLDLVDATGDRSLQCIVDMRTSLERFSGDVVCERVVTDPPQPAEGTGSEDAGATKKTKKKTKFRLKHIPNPECMSHSQEICRNANADGAPNEQLSLRFSKTTSLLPQIVFITRAEEHNCHVVLKSRTPVKRAAGWIL